jgi:hypothetical protein
MWYKVEKELLLGAWDQKWLNTSVESVASQSLYRLSSLAPYEERG